MERKINRVKLYYNDNEIANETSKNLTDCLEKNNFIICDDNYDMAIAVGGDGSFLRMVKREEYNRDLIYVGINAGTLGFLQEIKKEDIDDFISCLNKNTYKIEEIGIQESEVVTNNETHHFYSLNEILIREKDLNTVTLNVTIDGNALEHYVGDGLMIATSVGSTAYNLSFGGSIVYNTLHTLQITPIAPLNNRAYRNLINSVVVPEKALIKIAPHQKCPNLLLSIDGENRIFNDVNYIDTKVGNYRLKFLRLENYNFWEKVNEKFLTD